MSKVSDEQVEAGQALRWALDEIDTLSNKLCAFAYPQGMQFVRRSEQAGAYDHAVRARAALEAVSSIQGVTDDGRPLLDELTGALRFIMAFYEPGQTYLDTNAWKVAEAGGRNALAKGEAFLTAQAAIRGRESLSHTAGEIEAGGEVELPQEVIDLVIAAREVLDLGYSPSDTEANALDRALEVFSSRVPYENEPDASSQPGGGE